MSKVPWHSTCVPLIYSASTYPNFYVAFSDIWYYQIFSNCKLVQQHTSFNFYYFYLYLFSQKRKMSCNVTLGKLIPFFFFLGNINREVLEIEFLTTKTSLCFATPSIPAAWDVILLRHEVSPFIFQYFLLWFVVYICVVDFAKVFWFGSWLVCFWFFFFCKIIWQLQVFHMYEKMGKVGKTVLNTDSDKKACSPRFATGFLN